MGTFGGYTGSMSISDKKKKEFTKNLLKLLNYGGMMQLDKVCMYGKEITLIKPVEIGEKGKAYFHFNYFEDDAWESAGYESESADFFCGKIGGREFCDVVTAVHVLYELYDDGIGYAEINGEIVEASPYIGWLNHVLGTDFSLKKRFCLWEYFEKYCLSQMEYDFDNPSKSYDVMDTIPLPLYQGLGGTELADIFYITKGTESLQKEEIAPGSYPEMIYRCRELLKQYFDRRKEAEENPGRNIWELAVCSRAQRERMREGDIGAIAQISLTLPAHMLVYLASEIQKENFWLIWKDLHKRAYKDAVLPQYASDKLMEERKAAIEEPIEELTTVEFLRQDGVFAFWNTPEELKGQPNYYISDDDRAFWWNGSEEVVLSEKMDEWLRKLSQRHKKIVEELEGESQDQERFLRDLIGLLEEINDFYKRVFSFHSMFYEFLQNSSDRRYIAAVRLLEKLAEENKEAGKIIEHAKHWWDTTSKNVTHNAGRLAMKRYLSVMANKKLREMYFGF